MKSLAFSSTLKWLFPWSKRWATLIGSPEQNSGSSQEHTQFVAPTNWNAIGGSTHVQAATKSLDIGCGRSKTPGSIGIDRIALSGVDIVHNLEQFPWPFYNDEFSVIYANHFLEHVSDILGTLGEIHRISTASGRLIVRVPHYASDNFHTDLTHKIAFGYRSFDHFSINGKTAYDFYVPFKFEILSRRIKFMSPLIRLDPFRLLGIEALANMFPRIYERFFAYWLPPAEIQFELRIVK